MFSSQKETFLSAVFLNYSEWGDKLGVPLELETEGIWTRDWFLKTEKINNVNGKIIVKNRQLLIMFSLFVLDQRSFTSTSFLVHPLQFLREA